MAILGLNFSIDSAAALVEGGRIVAAAAQERFDRVKHSRAFPEAALNWCLHEAGLEFSELEGLAFFWNPALQLRAFAGRRSAHWRHQSEFYSALPNHVLGRLFGDAAPSLGAFSEQRFVLEGGETLRIHYVDHHLAHGAAAYYPSPFDEAAILTVDGYGEDCSCLLAHGRGLDLEELGRIPFPHSLGSVYAAVTEWLGYRPNDGEGTVMALAALAEAEEEAAFAELLPLTAEGFEVSLNYFDYYRESLRRTGEAFHRRFGQPRGPGDPLEDRHRVVAASLQKRLETVLLHLVAMLHERTGARKLCMAGGVALNSVANGRIEREGPFEELWVQPAAGDGGSSLGAALWVEHALHRCPTRHRMVHDFLGPVVTDEEARRVLGRTGLPSERCMDPARRAAELVARGQIVGWVQGAMEFGPRALGHRSILADPRDPQMPARLNATVKEREAFRPYAPAVKHEAAADWFVSGRARPFMLKVDEVRAEKRELIPAVVHGDGSARVQTVRRSTAPRFWKLLDAFEMATGCPVVLNTSFNRRGEPIVRTVEEALQVWATTGMDALMVGDVLVTKGR